MKPSQVFASLCLLLLTSAVCQAQLFSERGGFLYSLNSDNQVFDVAPNGSMAVSLMNDPAAVHPALLTVFNPVTGERFDSQTFGFGPLGVKLAQTANGLRAVVLTSQGGPRAIYLFDISSTGKLTQLSMTQLTTSGNDTGSNIVLSSGAQASRRYGKRNDCLRSRNLGKSH